MTDLGLRRRPTSSSERSPRPRRSCCWRSSSSSSWSSDARPVDRLDAPGGRPLAARDDRGQPRSRPAAGSAGRSARRPLRALVMGGVTLAWPWSFGLPAPLALGRAGLLRRVRPAARAHRDDGGRRSRGARERRALPAAIVAVAVLAGTTLLLPRILGPEPAGAATACTRRSSWWPSRSGRWSPASARAHPRRAGRDRAPRDRPVVMAALNGNPDREPETGIVPRWLDRIAQWSWRLLVLCGIVAPCVAGPSCQIPLIVIPLVLAAVAAATLAPGRRVACERRGLSAHDGVAGPDRRRLRPRAPDPGRDACVARRRRSRRSSPARRRRRPRSTRRRHRTSIASVLAAVGPQLVAFLGHPRQGARRAR